MHKNRHMSARKTPGKSAIDQVGDAPFSLAAHICVGHEQQSDQEDKQQYIECNDQKRNTANFRQHLSNVNEEHDMSSGCMGGVRKGEDFSDSDQDMNYQAPDYDMPRMN